MHQCLPAREWDEWRRSNASAPATAYLPSHETSSSSVRIVSAMPMQPIHRRNEPWPNPSIERTSSSRLRLLTPAAHVKR